MKIETIHGEVTASDIGKGPWRAYLHPLGFSIADSNNRQIGLAGPTCYFGHSTDSRATARTVCDALNERAQDN